MKSNGSTHGGERGGSSVSSVPVSAVRFFPAATVATSNGGDSGHRDRLSISRWKVLLTAFAAVNIVIGAVLNDAGHALWQEAARTFWAGPPPLGTQLNNVISDAAKGGYSLVGTVHNVQFRAEGALSRVLLFRPIDAQKHVSDELRIYDVVGYGTKARLKLRLLFQPRPAVHDPHTAAATLGAVGPRAFAIRLRLIRDLDGQPGNEIVADVSEYAVKPIWPRPVYVYWDPASNSFRIRALLSPATTAPTTPTEVITRHYLDRGDAYARALIDRVYTEPMTILDTAGNVAPFETYAVEAYVLSEESLHDPRGTTAGGLALTAGYIVKSFGFGTADLLQAVTWHIDLRRNPPTAKASAAHPTVIQVGTNWSHLTALLVRSRM